MKWLTRAGLLFLLLVILLLGAAAWLVGTESGLRWALERAQAAAGGRLAVEGASGTLAGSVRIARLAYEGEGFQLESRALHARADLLAALGGRLSLDPLQAASIEIVLHAGAAAYTGGSLRVLTRCGFELCLACHYRVAAVDARLPQDAARLRRAGVARVRRARHVSHRCRGERRTAQPPPPGTAFRRSA